MDYKQDFANEVYEKVDSGIEMKKCMQCGLCGSICPLREYMKYTPRKLWLLIRVGRRKEVLSSPDIMLCTSCYTCKIRCPRNISIIDIMHGLAYYALKENFIPRVETLNFGRIFWQHIYDTGRIDETLLPIQYYLRDGIFSGLKKSFNMIDIALSLLKTKRLFPKIFIPPNFSIPPRYKIKNIKQLQKMLDKAKVLKIRKDFS